MEEGLTRSSSLEGGQLQAADASTRNLELSTNPRRLGLEPANAFDLIEMPVVAHDGLEPGAPHDRGVNRISGRNTPVLSQQLLGQ